MTAAIFSQVGKAAVALFRVFKSSAFGLSAQNLLPVLRSVRRDPFKAFCTLCEVSLVVVCLFVRPVFASGSVGVRDLSGPSAGEFSPYTVTCAASSATTATHVKVFASKLVASDTVSLCCTLAIRNILSQCARAQVIRVNTFWYPAQMVNCQMCGDWASCKFIRKSMGNVVGPVISESTIAESICRSNPEPAGSRLQDSLIVSLIKRIGAHTESMPVALLKWKTFEVLERTGTCEESKPCR